MGKANTVGGWGKSAESQSGGMQEGSPATVAGVSAGSPLASSKPITTPAAKHNAAPHDDDPNSLGSVLRRKQQQRAYIRARCGESGGGQGRGGNEGSGSQRQHEKSEAHSSGRLSGIKGLSEVAVKLENLEDAAGAQEQAEHQRRRDEADAVAKAMAMQQEAHKADMQRAAEESAEREERMAEQMRAYRTEVQRMTEMVLAQSDMQKVHTAALGAIHKPEPRTERIRDLTTKETDSLTTQFKPEQIGPWLDEALPALARKAPKLTSILAMDDETWELVRDQPALREACTWAAGALRTTIDVKSARGEAFIAEMRRDRPEAFTDVRLFVELARADANARPGGESKARVAAFESAEFVKAGQTHDEIRLGLGKMREAWDVLPKKYKVGNPLLRCVLEQLPDDSRRRRELEIDLDEAETNGGGDPWSYKELVGIVCVNLTKAPKKRTPKDIDFQANRNEAEELGRGRGRGRGGERGGGGRGGGGGGAGGSGSGSGSGSCGGGRSSQQRR